MSIYYEAFVKRQLEKYKECEREEQIKLAAYLAQEAQIVEHINKASKWLAVVQHRKNELQKIKSFDEAKNYYDSNPDEDWDNVEVPNLQEMLSLEALESYLYERYGLRFKLSSLLSPQTSNNSIKPYHTLTPRQKEVLELVASGLSNEQISKELFIEETTTKTHLQALYNIYGLTGGEKHHRVALVLAYQKDLLSEKI